MAQSAPPVRWLFSDAKRRAEAWRYWFVDTTAGIYHSCLHYAMRILSIDACSNIGAFLAFCSPHAFRDSDARARKTWIRLRPDEADPASVDAAMRRLWRCVGRTMTEYSVIHRLWESGRISVKGIEYLRDGRATNKPLMIAALHLGNWEALLVAGIMLGFPGSGIYLPLENRFDLRLAIRARNRYKGGQVSAGPVALRAALRSLRQTGGPFVIFVDEFIRGRVQAPLFGRLPRPDSNIAYVARLAAMTDAALIPAYCVRVGDSARFEVEFLPPVKILRTEDRGAALAANVDRLNAAIEPVIRKYLDQWYYTLDFEFEDSPGPPLNVGTNRP